MKISPLAPKAFPDIAPIAGLSLTVLRSEERYKGRNDMLLAIMAPGTSSASVFTQSLTPGAPVIWSRQVKDKGAGRAMIVTAGSANVCTGKQGLANVQAMATATAKLGKVLPEQVFVSSTGVIGEQLNVDRVLAGLPDSIDTQAQNQDWQDAASAIMTTDTYPKASSSTINLSGKQVRLSGIAKGSGMIEPNMATMLSYLFTDAAIDADVLQAMLDTAVKESFNCITVDSDTSTSDTCLLFATGQAKHQRITSFESSDARALYVALKDLMQDLAQQIVKDGEGASKFITVKVSGAKTDQSASVIAKSIANSPLVKTAIAGEDANWGRIVMAVGKAGEAIKFDALTIRIGNIAIAEGNGQLQDYDESLVQAHIEGQNVNIDVDVGLGTPGSAIVWTCDLTHKYIDINADYRS
ncbi:MAG: bifunctional glutamate N-acetyltransferase/amino-acid acetyltransferase ArgJ [Methylococcales bacterium]|nr:bifunctional glutamate N-acetyltransferase/amino-acid acetyltransferase ArgJ [Methylococcales bacterium]